jgi:hypothetical protein
MIGKTFWSVKIPKGWACGECRRNGGKAGSGWNALGGTPLPGWGTDQGNGAPGIKGAQGHGLIQKDLAVDGGVDAEMDQGIGTVPPIHLDDAEVGVRRLEADV